MLKILIVLIIIGFVFFRIASFIFSGIFRGTIRNKQHSRYSYKARNGNVNIDSLPNKRSKDSKKNYGGEYIDYKEVK